MPFLKCSLSAPLTCLALLLWAASLQVFATRFEVVQRSEISLGNTFYDEVSGFLSNHFKRDFDTAASYRVPVTALLPKQRCNQVAIVDVVNSVLFEFPATAELGHNSFSFAGTLLGPDFLSGRRGHPPFVYLALQWNKTVTDETGIGMIEQGDDGYRILADAADWLRNYQAEQSDCKVEKVIGFGWSQTGKLLADLLVSDLNERPQGVIFDGIYLGVAGGRCRTLTDDSDFPWAYHNCQEPPESHVPTVALNTQSEIELSYGDGALRTPSDFLNIYDYAGLAHIDSQLLPFADIFASLGIDFNQNPVSVAPAVRATFWALYQQLSAQVAPPESQLMHAEPVDNRFVTFIDRRANPALLTWSGGQVYSSDANGDGVADGGVRLPHLPTPTRYHEQMGAPLGHYGGVDFRFAGGEGIFFANGGTFTPYSAEKLKELYPRHSSYIRLVHGQAWRLIYDGYLLKEDAQQLIREAMTSEIGR